MNLRDQVTSDMKDAMRAKDSQRLGTIRLLLAAIKQKEVDERIVVDDVQTLSIIEKLIKQRKDSVTAFDLANRVDLADKERAEISLLMTYMPAQMSADEVKAYASLPSKNQLIAGIINTLNSPVMGVMNGLKGNLQGLLDALAVAKAS